MNLLNVIHCDHHRSNSDTGNYKHQFAETFMVDGDYQSDGEEYPYHDSECSTVLHRK